MTKTAGGLALSGWATDGRWVGARPPPGSGRRLAGRHGDTQNDQAGTVVRLTRLAFTVRDFLTLGSQTYPSYSIDISTAARSPVALLEGAVRALCFRGVCAVLYPLPDG